MESLDVVVPSQCAFVSSGPGWRLEHLPRRSCSKRWRPSTTMKAPRPSGRSSKPRGPGRLSEEDAAVIEKTAAGFGVHKARPGEAYDAKYNTGKDTSKRPLPFSPPGYKDLVRVVGAQNLELAEKAVFVTLITVFGAFLTCGLAISSLAYFKATSTTPPELLDHFAQNTAKNIFTPSMIFFFGLSTIYGLYKQAQLNSGATSYTEISKTERE